MTRNQTNKIRRIYIVYGMQNIWLLLIFLFFANLLRKKPQPLSNHLLVPYFIMLIIYHLFCYFFKLSTKTLQSMLFFKDRFHAIQFKSNWVTLASWRTHLRAASWPINFSPMLENMQWTSSNVSSFWHSALIRGCKLTAINRV